jgi:transglutaminase-like putative cysteine protease
MCLFVALCRAAGIPARGVGGYVCATDCLLSPAAYHNWAQFYANGAWNMADPQAKRFLKHPDYIAMRIIDGFADKNTDHFHRFKAIGKSMEAKMKVWK